MDLTSSEISKKLKIHQNTTISRLNELIKMGYVEKSGAGKNTKYMLPGC